MFVRWFSGTVKYLLWDSLPTFLDRRSFLYGALPPPLWACVLGPIPAVVFLPVLPFLDQLVWVPPVAPVATPPHIPLLFLTFFLSSSDLFTVRDLSGRLVLRGPSHDNAA